MYFQENSVSVLLFYYFLELTLTILIGMSFKADIIDKSKVSYSFKSISVLLLSPNT